MKHYLSWRMIALSLFTIISISFISIKAIERTDWHFNDKKLAWEPPLFKKRPVCPSPLLASSPFDTSLATTVLYPGQYRGTDYKPHGGVGFSRNAIDVKLPLEARLISGSRYTQEGDVQYILDFQNDCGVIYRFDHLLTLAPEFQKIVDTLPPPKPNDTRGTRLKSPVFPAGTLVATAVGLPSMQNSGIDFGLYDLRQQNAISQNAYWRSLHTDELIHAAYGVCWFTLLPSKDAENIKRLENLYGTDYPEYKAVSDYCPAKAGTTLNQNNGLAPAEDY